MGVTRRTHSFSWTILGAMGVLAVAAVAAVTASSASSRSASPSASASASYKKGLQLAYFTSGGDNDYQKTNLRAAVETAKRYGEHMQTYAAHFQDALQLNQIMGAINGRHLDGIVIEAINPGTVCAPVKAALAKHIVVAITNVQACDTPYNVPYPGTAGYVGGQATSV
jgi:ABC-type sugar transport system substrate-binding protein